MSYYSDLKKDISSGSSHFFEVKEGDNRIRVVSRPIRVWKSFDENKVPMMYLTEARAKQDQKAKPRCFMYVINRDLGGKIQQAEFGPQIMSQFLDLAVHSEYGFEKEPNEIPPYDMILTRTGSGFETEYKLMPARNNTDLTLQERKDMASQKPMEEVIMEDKSIVDKDDYKIALINGGQPVTEENVAKANAEYGATPSEQIDLSQVPF